VATGAPREPGCPAWVVLGVKAVEARGALHGEMHSGGTTSPRDAQADVALSGDERLSAHPAQITGIAVSSASGWPPWPNRLGGNRMKEADGLATLWRGQRGRAKPRRQIKKGPLIWTAAPEFP
jgi:hypothetical protein